MSERSTHAQTTTSCRSVDLRMPHAIQAYVATHAADVEAVRPFRRPNADRFDRSAERMQTNASARILQSYVSADATGVNRLGRALETDVTALRVDICLGNVGHVYVAVTRLQLHRRAARDLQFDVTKCPT